MNEIPPAIADKLDSLWNIAVKAIQSRNFDRAEKALNVILKIDKHNATAYNRLGIIYARKREYKKAIRSFKKASKLEPSAASSHNLGLIYYEVGNYRKAQKNFEVSLDIDYNLASRHVALAKVYEKLTEKDKVLYHLEEAVKLEPTKELQIIYVDALDRYGKYNKFSKEIIEALRYNEQPWHYATINEYPVLLENLEYSHLSLQRLVFSKPSKRLTPRSKNARFLAIAYLHNLSAANYLLRKNYSIATTNIARSMYEISLKIQYGLSAKSNRVFASIELSALNGKINANQRLLKTLPVTNPMFSQKVQENKKSINARKALHRKYVNLQNAPSLRKIALELDGGVPGKNYFLYEKLYEKGSDILHANGESLSQTITLAKTRHAGSFVDSYELLKTLDELTNDLGNHYSKLPELSQKAKTDFGKSLQKD